MTPRRRWTLVAAVAVVVAAIPTTVASWPAQASDIRAADLGDRVAASANVGFSGSIDSEGTLQVPDTDSFAGVAQLLGESNQLRVWWRSSSSWRVDRVRATGETDLFRDGGRSTRWSFESETATVSPVSTIRLPDASDLIPATLARRMLQGVRDSELSRLPSRRVAGRSAAGLRLRPADAASTIDRVDLWADPDTGLPLKVRLFAPNDDRAVLTTQMLDVDITRPAASTTRFEAPRGVRVRFDEAVDVAAGANAFNPFDAPGSLAGFGRRGGAPEVSAVGVYGRGPTSFLAVPVRRRVSDPLRDRLQESASADVGTAGTTLRVGPLTVLVTNDRGRRGAFVLAGTVTPETLQRAAAELDRPGDVRR